MIMKVLEKRVLNEENNINKIDIEKNKKTNY